MMTVKRHIPTTNDPHDIRIAFGKLWDALEASSNTQTTPEQRRAAASGGDPGASSGTASSVPHNSLPFLQGGEPGEYYHLTANEYTGTGDGVFVRVHSPALAGDPTAPTPAVDDNDTSIATTAFFFGQKSTSLPLMDGVATIGSGNAWSPYNHVHPTDVTRAPINSPIFTGDPQAPTPTLTDNDTSLATTAFVKGQNYRPQPPNDVSKEITGFSDPTLITSTYNSAARTITLTGTFTAYYQGVQVAVLVSGWVSPAHSAITGPWFLFYDGSNFVWQQTSWTFDMLQIAFVYYGASDKFAIRETHGMMGWQTHEELHRTVGTYLESGGDLSSYVTSSTTAANRRPSVAATIIHDEDLKTTVPTLAAAGPYTQMYLSGASGTTTFVTGASDIIPLSGSRPYYNQFTGGSWVQTLMPSSDYVPVYLIAVPAQADAASQGYRYLWFQGQQESNSLAVAQSFSLSGQNLGQIASLFTEFVPLAKVLLRYTSGDWVIISVDKITGTRVSSISTPPGGLTTVAVTAPMTGTGITTDPVTVSAANTQVLYGTGTTYGSNANFAYTVGTGLKVNDATASSSATTGALIVTGGVGIGGDLHTSALVTCGNGTPGNTAIFEARGNPPSSNFQKGLYLNPIGTATATSGIFGAQCRPDTLAASFTCTDVACFWCSNAVKGAGSTITNHYGLYVENLTSGTNNYAIYTNANGLVHLGGPTSITDSTASSSAATGALVVTGGIGVGGNINIGGSAAMGGNITVSAANATVNINNSSGGRPWKFNAFTDGNMYIGANGNNWLTILGATGATTFSDSIAQSTTNGANWKFGQASELLTLSTAGLTTDTAANLLPANSIIEAVVARVTTTITTATSWALGDAVTPLRFAAANVTMTVGATSIGTVHADQTGAAGPRQVAAAKVRVTTVGIPGAGVIRITVFYRQFVAPTS